MNLNKAGRVQRLAMVSFLPLDSYTALAKLYHLFRASFPHLKISGLNQLGSRVSSSSKICKPHPVKSPWSICVSEMLFAGWLRPGLLSIDVGKGDSVSEVEKKINLPQMVIGKQLCVLLQVNH